MLRTGTILKILYEHVMSLTENRKVSDLRIGLGYAAVKLDDNTTGIAAVVLDTLSHGCTVMPAAGRFTGSSAEDLLKFLIHGKNPIEIALGLACANALIKPPIDSGNDQEATTYLNLKSGEKVAMVGLFSPLVDRIRSTGATLTVIEKNPDRLELLAPADKQKTLKDCDVAIITATTLLNNTFEETINLLGNPRSVALLGPSTPLLPGIFDTTPVTHLGGVSVMDAAKVLQIISEGGGTPALRPYLRFINLFLK
ncbi:MAG TPA: DUF364 domain-containing protein [Smithella sp.]|nr:DUF364 domain-containing protein [Smithella sp.]